ncbi:phage minor head protein [Hydrogenimonas thermophila]|uniref:phage head morphogenesis protein n=1 Tax=Hydrogenimonas thermophila TaxID=223786 RepID=UPI002936F184|nr:phage minor head protein [Hydrogenimonas thermophila]WOE69103.1 phage minor head protein [Hydrogenimonas thermophila]WOE71613.1 phage minor head protein [Hydrogenimonas thermophila]
MNKKELAQIFGMEPKEAYEFLASKGLKPTFSYTELKKEAHTRAFSVAKAMKLDLLSDIHTSLQDALKKGKPFKEWKTELKPTLKKLGWWGETEVTNPATGEVKKIYIGAGRLKTIYETNIRVAYNVGRYAHQQKAGKAVYWMYVSALLETTREKHRLLHGTVFERSHPFWQNNYPPNGYNCKCKVRAYTKKQLEQRGIKPVEGDVEDIADKGWEYNPGKAGQERLKELWRQKIRNAPGGLGEKSRQELELFSAFERAFENDKDIQTIMLANMPQFQKSAIKNTARYVVPLQTIEYNTIPTIQVMRHESAHHLDNIAGFISKELQKTLKKDIAIWQLKKDEIIELLKRYEDDIYLQDLFYLSSKGKIGYIQTREPEYLTEDKIHKEAFANFFEIHLSQDKRVEILQKYFKYSYTKFLKILKAIKEHL